MNAADVSEVDVGRLYLSRSRTDDKRGRLLRSGALAAYLNRRKGRSGRIFGLL
jgi:hypothetical protein